MEPDVHLLTRLFCKVDQVGGDRKHVATLLSDERVIVDPELTVRWVYSIFNWYNNIGALSGICPMADVYGDHSEALEVMEAEAGL
ncbi:hypothetical protein EYZ11_004672 [Aspergillus tanneri]|uniref:Uncharacterized protein n=1 Tax=Aspergillus tanneri TaxID=1220188 RepID=A0A4S3JKF0_9EURO|nr:hypothetical protein EYZ11_004672 [Aspergillus tanneri]